MFGERSTPGAEEITLKEDDSDIRLALQINTAMVRREPEKLVEAVAEFMQLHHLTVTPACAVKIPLSGGSEKRAGGAAN